MKLTKALSRILILFIAMIVFSGCTDRPERETAEAFDEVTHASMNMAEHIDRPAIVRPGGIGLPQGDGIIVFQKDVYDRLPSVYEEGGDEAVYRVMDQAARQAKAAVLLPGDRFKLVSYQEDGVVISFNGRLYWTFTDWIAV
jgi:hypothetical protein